MGRSEIDEAALVDRLIARQDQNFKNALEWVRRAERFLADRDCGGASRLLRQALLEIGCDP